MIAARIKSIDFGRPKEGLLLATRRHFRVRCQPEVEAAGSALRSASDDKVGIYSGHGAKVTLSTMNKWRIPAKGMQRRVLNLHL